MKTTLKKISADEAHNFRKDVTNDAGVMAKSVPVSADVTRAAKFDAGERTARFTMSAEVEDRMGDVVSQQGLDLTNFLANPQAPLFHNTRAFPVGQWEGVEKILTGRPKRTEGTLRLLPEGDDPDADRVAKHLAAGTLRTVSIGFRPRWNEVEAITDEHGHYLGLKFNSSELLECSVVPVPALPAATMKELSVGALSPESLELIRGVLEGFELRDGQVQNRSQLEGAVRGAEGNRTTHVIDLKALPVGSILRKEEDGTITLVEKAGDPPAPKDGEEVPVAPDPAAGEKQKADEQAQDDSVAAFNAHTMTVAREHAMRSQEPGLWAKFLAALGSIGGEPMMGLSDAQRKAAECLVPTDEPSTNGIALEPAALTAEEKAALEERIANRIRATERATEPA